MQVSIVVPTHNRHARLACLLAALEPAPEHELIVVDDGSQPPVDAPGARIIRNARPRGPAAARNAGWRAARAPFVAFLDDDCEPRPGWLAALLALARDDTIVQGRVDPDPRERAQRPGPFTRTLSITRQTPFFPTANALYPRALLERLGGFDEAFPFPAGEDTDLGWRAQEQGARVAFADAALVWHAVHPLGVGGMVRDAAKWHTTVRVVKRHPGVRAHLTHRVFWKPAHERLLVGALAGALLARRTRGASLALALAAYAHVHRLEHGSWAGTLARLPFHLAIDGAEVAAMVRGSLRERTLLL